MGGSRGYPSGEALARAGFQAGQSLQVRRVMLLGSERNTKDMFRRVEAHSIRHCAGESGNSAPVCTYREQILSIWQSDEHFPCSDNVSSCSARSCCTGKLRLCGQHPKAYRRSRKGADGVSDKAMQGRAVTSSAESGPSP